jgi:hypothetical protein
MRDLTRQDAEDEATGMYLCRVPVRQCPPQRPHCLVEEAPSTHMVLAQPAVSKAENSSEFTVYVYINLN